MRLFRVNRLLFLLCGLLCLSSCSRPLPLPPVRLTDAEKKLVKICKNEYGLDVVVKRVGQTVWVYAPVEDPFFALKVTDEGPQPDRPPDAVRAVHFIDVTFDAGSFKIRYDISASKKAAISPGYNYQYTPAFNDHRRRLMTALSQSFGDLEPNETTGRLQERVAGDVDYAGSRVQSSHKQLVQAYVKTEKAPLFAVVVLADIKEGLETQTLLYVPDLYRGMTDPSFMEEYTRRLVSSDPTGCTDIIGDTAGKHLDYHDLSWQEFLTKQIRYRIRFKFTQSTVPPADKVEDEILKITAQVLTGYRITDYTGVALEDLDTKDNYLFSREQVEKFKE